MSDRLPEPSRFDTTGLVERASATPTRRTALPVRHEETASAKNALAPTPRSLREVQGWMLEAVTAHASDDVEAVVTAGPRLDAAARLGVYQTAYHARLVECLVDDYPVVAAALGEERFEQLAHAYVHVHPSTSPSLNAFGRHMAAFATTAASTLSPAEGAFYADLALVEWAIVEVIHARTPPPFDAAALQQIPVEAWATARFVPSDAVRLLRLAHPANAFMRSYRETDVLPEVPSPSAIATVVYRKGATVWRMDLTPAMARVLGALLGGATIGDALGEMGTDESDPEALAEAERSVMVWFREWVDGAMFADLVFSAS